jgi:hypothetical protein
MSGIYTVRDEVRYIAEDDLHVLAIVQDESRESPREWSNLGIMVCFHKRYNLGDEGHGYRSEDFSSWDELREHIEEAEDPAVILPLYLYDHSGITISTGPFGSNWDSGQVGFIFARRKDVKEEFLIEEIVGEMENRVKKILEGEIKTYDMYLRGDVYGYIIEKKDGEVIDSCYGFYGEKIMENGMAEQIGKEFKHLVEIIAKKQ